MGNDVKRIMSFPESCAPPTKKCIIQKNSCAGFKKIIFNSNTVFVFLLGPVFGQRPICSIISCLIIGAIFPSQDRALFVLPNIAQPTTSSSLSSKETDATTSIAIIIATILFLLQILTLAIFPLLKPNIRIS